MSESDPEDPFRPALDVDGNLVNRLARVEPPRPQPPNITEGPLELAERAPRVAEPLAEAYREEPPEPPRPRVRVGVWLVAGALLLGLGVLTAVLLVPRGLWPPSIRSYVFGATLPGRERAAVVITSEPPNATVRIAGVVVGTTPWAGDNLWGDTTVTVDHAGYAPFTARLKAGEPLTLEAQLKRR